MSRRTFADMEYEGKKKQTRREKFLGRMEALIPWQRLEERIRPYYPQAGRGRRPYELSAMLRIHCVQLFYNMSDPGMEDMLYEIESVRRLVGLSLAEPLPDETTILHFRHLLEKHKLGGELLAEINRRLEAQGLRLQKGTIVDASIIEAPSSQKNGKRERDGEMKQTRKRRQLATDSAAGRRKAAVRAKVEHPFLYVRQRFGYAKVRYRSLAKNRERLNLLFGLANLLIAERYARA